MVAAPDRNWRKKKAMSSSKDYRDYVLDQMSKIEGITCRPMMGEYLLYLDGLLFGGIYDNNLMVKITGTNERFGMEKGIPYAGANPMYLVGELDDAEALKEIVESTCEGLAKR